MNPLRQQFVDEISTWEGTPYFYNGKAKGVGANCMFFVMDSILKTLPVDSHMFDDCWDLSEGVIVRQKSFIVADKLDLFCTHIGFEEMEIGDLAVTTLLNLPLYMHVKVGSDLFIQCTKTVGVYAGQFLPSFSRRLYGCYRPNCFEGED